MNSEYAILSRQELEVKYRFSGKYFLLPNQFWRHKNHSTVIEALGTLKSEGKKVLILMTGNTKDYRQPEYFASLMTRAKELNVLDSFCCLGVVSAKDLTALMQHSHAIINPSFFEGWSTTVEEAKSLGKCVILSDIPVHREQDPPLATYFLPNDVNTFASVLWEIWNKPDMNDNPTIQDASDILDKRRFSFANKYQEIVLSVLNERNGK
jgi:glycosyltransferase involved in cell wall biosynthesis